MDVRMIFLGAAPLPFVVSATGEDLDVGELIIHRVVKEMPDCERL